jgi:pimeloyl-ACP methyl ester carboxylesterase
MRQTWWAVVVSGSIALACGAVAVVPGRTAGRVTLDLTPCHLAGLAEEVACGVHEVYEDREAGTGRRLGIHVAVLPPLRRSAAPDPLFMMAGGPGQGARRLGAAVDRYFRQIRRTRAVVLVDLRGTGDSAPLDCPGASDELAQIGDMIEAGETARRCLDAIGVDPHFYTHAHALADLDEIRQRLGYDRINLWGGSWGTRASLLYALRYPDAVRRVVLDGAVPLDMQFPRSAAADAERTLDLLFADCAATPECQAEFGSLRSEYAGLLERLDREPATARIRHPRTGETTTLRVVRDAVAEIVRVSLYTPVDAARLFQVLTHAVRGDFEPLAAQFVRLASVTTDEMAIATTMSVLCSEDLPLVAGVDFDDDARGTSFRATYADVWRRRCEAWPAGPALGVPPHATSPAPALILSGLHDPVTPPRWGDEMARHFPASRHIVVPGAAHNASFTACMPEVIARFLDATPEGPADDACATTASWPAPVVSNLGTRP